MFLRMLSRCSSDGWRVLCRFDSCTFDCEFWLISQRGKYVEAQASDAVLSEHN